MALVLNHVDDCCILLFASCIKQECMGVTISGVVYMINIIFIFNINAFKSIVD